MIHGSHPDVIARLALALPERIGHLIMARGSVAHTVRDKESPDSPVSGQPPIATSDGSMPVDTVSARRTTSTAHGVRGTPRATWPQT